MTVSPLIKLKPCFIFLALFTLPLHATTVLEEHDFTFERVLKQAFLHNLGLQIEVEQLAIQQHKEVAAFRKFLPALSLNTSRNQTAYHSEGQQRELSYYSSRINITQVIYHPALWAGWKKSELTQKQADYILQRKQQSLLFELKKAWYTLLAERQINLEAQASLKRLIQHQKNAEAFFKNGKIWRNDVLQAKVRVAKGERDLFAANNRLEVAKSEINLILNRDITLALNPIGKLTKVYFKSSLKPLLNQALDNRLELKQSALDINLAQQDVALSSAKLKPTLNFSLSSSVNSENIDYRDAIADVEFNLALNWDFWQWGQTKREINAAEGNVTVKKLSYAQKKAITLIEVKKAYLTVIESQKSLHVAEQALDQAKENFRVSQIRYQEQLGSSNDVLDAQDLLTQTRNDRTSALSRYLTALAELHFAIGLS